MSRKKKRPQASPPKPAIQAISAAPAPRVGTVHDRMKEFWKDPVFSKVIATCITAIAGVLIVFLVPRYAPKTGPLSIFATQSPHQSRLHGTLEAIVTADAAIQLELETFSRLTDGSLPVAGPGGAVHVKMFETL